MIKDDCFNDPNSTFEGVELRSLKTIFRVMSCEYKTVEEAKGAASYAPQKPARICRSFCDPNHP